MSKTTTPFPILIAALLVWAPAVVLAEATLPDTTALARFEALSGAERTERADAAKHLLAEAEQTDDGRRRRTLMARAAASDPSVAETWLDLAALQRSTGYRGRAETSLAAARATLETEDRDRRRQQARRYCLERAWLDYDLGRWETGLAWADKAVRRGAGQAGHLVAALNRAGTEIGVEKWDSSLRVFYPLDTNTNRRVNRAWAYLMWMQMHSVRWDAENVSHWLHRSTKFAEHDVARWRDFGLICEANGEAVMAERFYRRSRDAMPLDGGGWLRESAALPPGARDRTPLPFWTNEENWYVTGSLMAYCTDARNRLDRARGGDDEAHWAERLLDAATAGVHRHPRRPWMRLWRAEALLSLDRLAEAEEEATLADSWFEELGIDEPAVEPVLGRIRLLEKDYRAADQRLAAAVAAFPDDARCWADLGLAHVMLHRRAEARSALDRALELDPDSAVAWHNRGLLNLEEGDAEAAIADMTRAADLAPHDETLVADLQRARRAAEILRRSGR